MCVRGSTIMNSPKTSLDHARRRTKNRRWPSWENFLIKSRCEWMRAEGSVCHCISLFKYPTSKKPLCTSNKFSSSAVHLETCMKKGNKNQVFCLYLYEDYWMDSFCGLKGLLGGSVHTKDQGAGNSFVFPRHKTLEKRNWKNFHAISRCPVGSFSILLLILMSCLASPGTAYMK